MNSIFKPTISDYKMKRAIGFGVLFLLLAGYTLAQNLSSKMIIERFASEKLRPAYALQHPFLLLKLNPNTKSAELTANKINVIRRLSNEYVIVKGSNEIPSMLVAEFYRPSNNWKYAESVLSLQTDDEEHEFYVQTLDPKETEKFLKDIRITYQKVNTEVFLLHTSMRCIEDRILARAEVTSIAIESHKAKTESRVLELYLAPNRVNQIHDQFPNLNGEGRVLSLKELQFDPEDIDLIGRAIPTSLAASEIDNHATDMATIAAGAGNSFVTGKGVAWKANITSSDYANLLPDASSNFTALNAWVQNHSYGTVLENMYGVLARAYDQSANQLPHLLHVFSSGNEGAATPSQGSYQGQPATANLTGNFKMSKNSLCVGAVDTIGRAIPFSSRGPAYDGRVKPEVVAYSVQGTSNSAALVSGISILLQQTYFERKGSIPESSLLKSILINSAEDAGSPGLDFITGFGNVNAYRAVQHILGDRYITATAGHGEVKSFSLNVPAEAANLKVTIVWNDPAANANSSTALVNDLDLVVKDPNGVSYFPWTLDPSAGPDLFNQQAVRGKDHLNNVEQVSVTDVPPGAYTIEVSGYDVPSGPQQFYVSYQWDESNSFRWKFPTGEDNFPYNGETGTYFYWNSTLPTGIGTLEYTTDNGSTWQTIATDLQLSKGYYRWNIPPEINSRAKARMIIGTQQFESAEFVISFPPRMSVGFNCSDSVMVQWNKQSEASSYIVYALNGSFMQPFTTTADTFTIIKKSTPSTRYAVEATLTGNRQGIRSATIDHETFGVDCYLVTFYDELNPAEGIYLNVLLGTTYYVDNVLFEREIDGQFILLGEVTPKDKLVRFLDENPRQGINRYRARILFANEREVVTQTIEDFFITKSPFAIFPNPISANDELRIFSKAFSDMHYTFRLFKSDGSLVTRMDLNTDREFIPLNGIPAGLYIYHLTSEEGRFTGKLLIY